MTGWRITSTGVDQQAPADVITGRRLDRLIAEAPAGEHVWIVTTAYRVGDAASLVGRVVHLDAESLVLVAGPGCYVCEQEFRPGMERTRCPGDPSGRPR